MAEFGQFTLALAWILSLAAIYLGVTGARKQRESYVRSAANATVLLAGCTALAMISLAYSFLHDDYTVQYVWQYSNRDMDSIYKVSAIWGGMDGSMLLWCFILSLSSAVVALRSSEYPTRLAPWVLVFINTTCCFFLTVDLFLTNPFRFLNSDFIPPDGNGLNPLLQNPYMAIHPPMLYLGFTTLSIPYAFCMGALASGSLTNEWIRLTRIWTLLAFAFLTTGIVLGGHWAYIELGWGGFWAWDPVENASFMPWLTGTAFLHSVLIQERKNMLKFWNVWLIVLTYALTVFGTFLTRSGVVQSVHAFASTDIGWIFLVYLGLIFFSAGYLTFLRRRELRPERTIESILSREAMFLLNNLVLLAICFAVLWGVMFPVLSEALTGEKQTVGIPFFNKVAIPLFLLLILLMGIGPLVAWRRSHLKQLRKAFLAPLILAFVVGCVITWAGVTSFYAVLSYSLCWFVLTTIIQEFHRGLRAQRIGTEPVPALQGVGRLFRRHQARYSGYLIHFGVLIATIGITASMAHKIEREVTISQGERAEVGRFSFELQGFEEITNTNYQAYRASLKLRQRGSDEVLETLHPEMRRYFRNQENTSEVALRMGLREDVYAVLAGIEEGGKASLKIFINPLQVWLWIGAVMMVGGTVLSLLPLQRQTARAFNLAELAAAGGTRK